MEALSIGDAAQRTGLSQDTLRYYEKIGLLPRTACTAAGHRCYTEADLTRLRFIQRAKRMHLSLDEIQCLLQWREHPEGSRADARRFVQDKLAELDERIRELQTLRQDLAERLTCCQRTACGCPILQSIEDDEATR